MKHAVDVSGDITPITQEPISPVNAVDWKQTATLGQLTEELSTLQNRLIIAHQMNKPEMVKQIERGMQLLQAVINERTKKEGTTFV